MDDWGHFGAIFTSMWIALLKDGEKYSKQKYIDFFFKYLFYGLL